MTKLRNLLLVPAFLSWFAFSPLAEAADAPTRWIDIEMGASYIHKDNRDIARIVMSDGEVADIKSLRPGQFQVRGLKVGTTDLWVWYSDDQDNPQAYQVTVHQDLSDLVRRVDQLVEGTPPRVYPLGERLVVEGPVSDVETLERIAQVSRIYDEDFVNLMTVQGDHQVQLEVVFAEVSRTGLRELSIQGGWAEPHYSASGKIDGFVSLLALWAAGGTAGQLSGSGPELSYLASNASAFNFLGFLDMKELGGPSGYKLMGLLSALEEYRLTKILAQPTLVALSGQQAEFLAGGEVPIPIALEDSISVQFKDYGIKLVFVPTVLAGDLIDLRVYTEVSEVDSSNSVQVSSLAIPGFLVRKGSSHLRMESGMTFAMAGLLSETVNHTRRAVPLLGEIPVLGALFRTVSHDREERELMIFVTPRLVRPLAAGEVPPPPGTTEKNLPNDFELFMLGMDYSAGSRTAEPTGPVGLER